MSLALMEKILVLIHFVLQSHTSELIHCCCWSPISFLLQYLLKDREGGEGQEKGVMHYSSKLDAATLV